MKDDRAGSKRTNKRISSKLDITCQQNNADGKINFWCVSNDVSEFGVQITSDQLLDTAKSVLLHIVVPSPQKMTVTVVGKIRWRRESKAGANSAQVYTYGISFEEVDAKEQEALFKYLFSRQYVNCGIGKWKRPRV
jgi:c-di-GMP-binding flagellar brake protein YcgR